MEHNCEQDGILFMKKEKHSVAGEPDFTIAQEVVEEEKEWTSKLEH